MSKSNPTFADLAKKGFAMKDGVMKKIEPVKGKDKKLPVFTIDLNKIPELTPDEIYDKFKDLKLSDYTTIGIKPMTVNRAWRGKRFKTPQYNNYCKEVSAMLPANIVIPEGLLKVYYEFGMSTNSDFDNPVKPFQDILQAKYHFNDSKIIEAVIRKVVVKKGEEYIKFKIESL